MCCSGCSFGSVCVVQAVVLPAYVLFWLQFWQRMCCSGCSFTGVCVVLAVVLAAYVLF